MKNSVKRMKKQTTHWEKIFADHISDEGLVSRHIKNSQNSTLKKKKLKSTVSQENRHKIQRDIIPKRIYKWRTEHEKLSTPLALRVMQVKTKTRLSLHTYQSN